MAWVVPTRNWKKACPCGLISCCSQGLICIAPFRGDTTHCRFRNARVKAGAYDGLLAEVCRQIEGHRLKMKEADAAIIDATLIESAARPRTHVEAPPEDRAENKPPMSLHLLFFVPTTMPDGLRKAARAR